MKLTPEGVPVTTIYRENADRLSVADAKRLILETLPPEKSAEIYARVDENGDIDFEGPVELREVHGVQIYAGFIDRDFLSMCEQLSIQPRMKYRPMFTGYSWKSSVDDTLYTITHNEFVRLAELFGLLVVTGKARESELPAVPTIAEAGFPSAEAEAWIGLVAPAKTPAPIVSRINRELETSWALPVFVSDSRS